MMIIEDFKLMLALRKGLDYSQWGIGGSKTVEELLKEIDKKECRLAIIHTPGETHREIVREVSVVYITVTFKGKVLVEKETIYKNGREPRIRELRGSVAGRMIWGEEPKFSAMREIKEELGLNVSPARLKQVKTNDRPLYNSSSYPGIKNQLTEHYFELELEEDEFKPDGYQEEAEDKTIYFVWE